MFRTHTRGSAAFAGREAGTHPSLFHRRAGGISHGRSLRGRAARRDIYHHGETRLDHLRADGCLRNGGLACPAARRTTARALRKTQPHALRAQRLVRQSEDRLRQIAYGLHREVARTPVLDWGPGRIVQSPSDPHSASEGCQWYGSGWRARRTYPDGRCTRLQHLRFADGTERNLLSLHDVRRYKRVFVASPLQSITYTVWRKPR